MKLFKRFIGFSAAVILSFTSTASITLAGEKPIQKFCMPISELYQNFNENDRINLDAFEQKNFNGKYGNQLDTASRAIYDVLESSIDTTKDGVSNIGKDELEVMFEDGSIDIINAINLTGKTTNDELERTKYQDILYAFMAFDYDHPEVFWINFDKISFTEYYVPDECWISIGVSIDCDNYYCSDEYDSKERVEQDIKKINNVRDKVKKETENKSTYEKLEYINSFLVDKNEYNRFLGKVDNSELDLRVWKCVSALIYGTSNYESPGETPSEPKNNKLNPVCEGYSRAFKFLCDNLGIECVLASGKSISIDEKGKEKSDDHMWNYVKMSDNNWYAIDCTFNDSIFLTKPSQKAVENAKKSFFLIGDGTLKNGIKENNKHIPETDGIVYEEILDTDENGDSIVLQPSVDGLSYPILKKDDYPIESSGDVNKDRVLDFSDASELLNHVLNGTVNDYHRTVAHFDKSKKNITANDVAILIKRILAEK